MTTSQQGPALAATGALLAGGRSSRLGQPKAHLQFAGRALGQHLLDRLAAITTHQLIVTNDPAAYATWHTPLTSDPPEFAGLGPLAGILAAIEASAHDAVFALACDLPFFSPDLAAHMLALQGTEGAAIVIPEHDGLLEPLCAVYTRTCREVIRARLGCGVRRVAAILPDLQVRYLRESEYGRFGTTERLFFNINTAADLATARREWLTFYPGTGPEQHQEHD